VSLDPVSVDVVVDATPVVVDAVLTTPVEAVDVTAPLPAPVFADAVLEAPVAAVDVTAPTGPAAVDAVMESTVEVVETIELGEPIFVDVSIGEETGGGGGLTGTTATFGSVTPISPGTTAYVGVGWSILESKAEFLVMVAGEVTDFAVSIGAQDLGTGSIVATVRKLGADTALSVMLSGFEQAESVSGSVIFAKGDRAAIKVAVSADVPGGVMITPTWRLVPS
jgi:hypothetical protein